MKFDEKHLAQLAAVVEVGGVTEGAHLLGMTQPAVSRTLAMMEKRLGERLFLPGRRPLVPTLIGRQLAAHGKVILEASRKASETAISYRAGSSGTVRIGGVPFFMDAFISRMIGRFQRVAPDIRVDQSYGNQPDLHADLRSGQIDLAVCPTGLMLPGTDIAFTEILPARNVVAASSHHPLAKTRRPTSADVLRYPWIAPLPGSPLLADLHSILLSIGMKEIQIRYSGGSLLSVLNYLQETEALTVLPHSVVFAYRTLHQIQTIPIQIPQPDRALGIMQIAGAPQVPAADRLKRYILSEFEEIKIAIQRHENAVVWG